MQQEIRRVSDAGTALEEIRQSCMTATDQSRQISSATLVQLQRTQDVVRAMQQLSANANRIDERSESIRHKTTDLVEAAQGLEEGLSPMYHFGDSDSPPVERRISSFDSSAARTRQSHEAGDELLEAVTGGEFAQ